MKLEGIHHITLITGDAPRNVDFYTRVLGLRMVAKGDGAHYPMLSSAISEMVDAFPSAAKDVGFFALPGADASKNGATRRRPTIVPM